MMNSRRLALVVTSALVFSVVGCDSMSRPSDAEVRQCIQATRDPLGSISQVEFGNTMASQGGMMELAMGAPKDTKIFPVNIHFPSGMSTTVMTYWAFKDSFGQLKCVRAPGGDTRTYQTAEQVAQEAEQRRVAAQQQAERERIQAEQQRAQAEQAEAQRLAEERASQERERQVRAATDALASADCRDTSLTIPSRTTLSFVVPSTKECWTPWLALETAIVSLHESGNVLIQVTFHDGTTGTPFEDGPKLVWRDSGSAQRIRFKSLRNEPVTISIGIQ